MWGGGVHVNKRQITYGRLVPRCMHMHSVPQQRRMRFGVHVRSAAPFRSLQSGTAAVTWLWKSCAEVEPHACGKLCASLSAPCVTVCRVLLRQPCMYPLQGMFQYTALQCNASLGAHMQHALEYELVQVHPCRAYRICDIPAPGTSLVRACRPKVLAHASAATCSA